MKTKRSIFKKLACLIAVFTMLIGSTLGVSAAEDNQMFYLKADGSYEWTTRDKIPAVGMNGCPVFVDEFSGTASDVTGVTPGGIWVYGNLQTLYTPEQIALLYSVIDSAGITNEMSQYDKAVALNNAQCAVMDYDITQGSPYDDGLLALQIGAGADCVEFADLYQTLCQTVGINCQRMNNTAWHQFNVLFIDGVKYYNDPSSNDVYGNNRLMSTELFPGYTAYLDTTTPEGQAALYFPMEFRTVRNYGPEDAAEWNVRNMERASQEDIDDLADMVNRGEWAFNKPIYE